MRLVDPPVGRLVVYTLRREDISLRVAFKNLRSRTNTIPYLTARWDFVCIWTTDMLSLRDKDSKSVEQERFEGSGLKIEVEGDALSFPKGWVIGGL